MQRSDKGPHLVCDNPPRPVTMVDLAIMASPLFYAVAMNPFALYWNASARVTRINDARQGKGKIHLVVAARPVP
jgi:hypothetical protein